VCVKQQAIIYVPAAFSPNGDNINDFLVIQAYGIEDFEMYVYNRWGQQIFESRDINFTWDGTFKDNPVQIDGYPYVIFYKNRESGDKEIKKGMVMVVR